MMKPLPSQAYLHERLDYDPKTGSLTWKPWKNHQAWTTRFAGNEAGSLIKGLGYRDVRLNNIPYYAHRIIWKMMTGRDPVEQIDHADLDRANNIWSNLREAAHSDNVRNVPMHAGNQSGWKGVVLHSRRKHKPYRAQITVGNRTRHLGFFDSPELAHAVYLTEAKRLFGKFARGV